MKTMRVFPLVLVAACGASNTQLGRDRYEIRCENGIAECRQIAFRLCPDGFTVEGGKSGAFTQSMIARCKPSKAEMWREPAAVTSSSPQATTSVAAPVGSVECMRDFQCTKPGARCIDGKCIAEVQNLAADDTDRCIVGTTGSAGPTPMFTTEKAATEFAVYSTANREAAFDLVVRLGGTWVEAGVRCKTLRVEAQARYVQLLSGPLAGREGWLGGLAAAFPKDAGID